MIKANISSVSAWNGDFLHEYISADPENDSYTVRMMIGPAGFDGHSAFDIEVCTTGWLAREVAASGPVLGGHRLVVNKLDLIEVEQFLRKRVEAMSGETWMALAMQLARIAHWEEADIDGRPPPGYFI
ncbi:MAG: Imm8 family immunity protein [Microbacteriaceae bacterium]